jgi:hypothetical protein
MTTFVAASEVIKGRHGSRVNGSVVHIFKTKASARQVAERMLIAAFPRQVHTRFQSCWALYSTEHGGYATREYIAELLAKYSSVRGI